MEGMRKSYQSAETNSAEEQSSRHWVGFAIMLRSRFPRDSKLRHEERNCGLNFLAGECVNEWQGPVRPKLSGVCAVNCPRDFRGLLAHRRSRIRARITE